METLITLLFCIPFIIVIIIIESRLRYFRKGVGNNDKTIQETLDELEKSPSLDLRQISRQNLHRWRRGE